jgi:hypothetical protein
VKIVKKYLFIFFFIGIAMGFVINVGDIASAKFGDNPEAVLKDKAEADLILKEIEDGKRERLDYPVKIYNAKGELVLETTESYLREHRKEIEEKYNLIPDKPTDNKKVSPEIIQKAKEEKYGN